ncbi:WecB/TagA/CpsF family glycosyltransferase [Aromatoleum bremense]|uniref:WecB/TagA/CpsF family glycosyltransferase n=1 Tax=Aromatoleum bremense TaxID=76115 RepID=UPI001BB67F7A|nr:WecB/TagA/CpsF family glycosyltransferase [Aromatoleum bremense]QTQ33566.1 Putative N-acetylmannosaminyltransferase [Aromatoleum bremense]
MSLTASRVQALNPSLKLAGYHHGYFWSDEAGTVEKIRASGAQLLFVTITSPKKENFINCWRDQLGVTFVMARLALVELQGRVAQRAVRALAALRGAAGAVGFGGLSPGHPETRRRR